MVFQKISIHNRNLQVRKDSIKNWKISDEDKKDLIKFLEDFSLGKVSRGKRIGEARQLKYLDMLKIPLEFFKKPTSKLIVKDTEAFEKALISNKILSYKKKPLEDSTKLDIRNALKVYLRWKLGDNDKLKDLVGWFDTRLKTKTPEYLSEAEVEKIYKACDNARDRYLIAVLFDSGARAEEFVNLRYEDIQLPKNNESYVKITIKAEYSKTQGRVISLYWKYSLEAVKDYLKERESEGIKHSEAVFNSSYDNARQFIYRLGRNKLKKNIHFHLFRHSSATFYASQMNRQQLCYRYGWKFSSDMPDIYISRAGMQNEELDNKFEQTEMNDLKAQMEKQRKELDMLKDLLVKSVEKGEEILKAKK